MREKKCSAYVYQKRSRWCFLKDRTHNADTHNTNYIAAFKRCYYGKLVIILQLSQDPLESDSFKLPDIRNGFSDVFPQKVISTCLSSIQHWVNKKNSSFHKKIAHKLCKEFGFPLINCSSSLWHSIPTPTNPPLIATRKEWRYPGYRKCTAAVSKRCSHPELSGIRRPTRASCGRKR
jgi:hypothetical protein